MPARPCKWPTCTTFVPMDRTYCDAHDHHRLAAYKSRDRSEVYRSYDLFTRDKDAKAFYNSADWQRVRRDTLADEPVCRRCLREWAEHVHHIKPLKECTTDERLDRNNLAPVCPGCHTAIEQEIKTEKRS